MGAFPYRKKEGLPQNFIVDKFIVNIINTHYFFLVAAGRQGADPLDGDIKACWQGGYDEGEHQSRFANEATV